MAGIAKVGIEIKREFLPKSWKTSLRRKKRRKQDDIKGRYLRNLRFLEIFMLIYRIFL